jgi:catechol 2,3-dioxygenase-like lactoylglutathione lyase family enzyme
MGTRTSKKSKTTRRRRSGQQPARQRPKAARVATQKSRRPRRPARQTRPPARRALEVAAEPMVETVEFVEIVPSLAVADVARARAFYARLGFRVAAQLPPSGSPEWLRLERGKVALFVWNEVLAPPQMFSAIVRARGAGNVVHIRVADADRLLREFQEQGVPVSRPTETLPEGIRQFTVTDPDGFVLEFATPVTAQLALL